MKNLRLLLYFITVCNFPLFGQTVETDPNDNVTDGGVLFINPQVNVSGGVCDGVGCATADRIDVWHLADNGDGIIEVNWTDNVTIILNSYATAARSGAVTNSISLTAGVGVDLAPGEFHSLFVTAPSTGAVINYELSFAGSTYNAPPQVANPTGNFFVLENAPDTKIDLRTVFEDDQDPDSTLNYFVRPMTTPFYTTSIDAADTLRIDYEMIGIGDTTMSIFAVDSQMDTTEATFSITVIGSNVGFNITGDTTFQEGNAGRTTHEFTILKTGSTNLPSRLDFLFDGNAIFDNDYDSIRGTSGVMDTTAGTIVFMANETEKTLVFDVLGDLSDEFDDTVRVTLSNPRADGNGGASIVTAQARKIIEDDDPEPTVQFVSAVSDGGEGTANPGIPVRLSQPSDKVVTVDFSVGGTATGGGTDHALADGTLTFNPRNGTRPIVITNVVDDDLEEGPETVVLTLSNPTNATLGATTTHTYTINDNDPDGGGGNGNGGKLPQTIVFAPIEDKRAGEPPFELQATGGGSGNPVTFTISTDPASGVASLSGNTVIVSGPGTVTITANQAGNEDYQDAAPVSRTFIVLPNASFLPDLFTPNGDGRNDRFIVRGGSNVRSVTFSILDRDGNVVFESNDWNEISQIGWDGTNGGKDQPGGTYMWVVEGTLDSGDEFLINGKETGLIKLLR